MRKSSSRSGALAVTGHAVTGPIACPTSVPAGRHALTCIQVTQAGTLCQGLTHGLTHIEKCAMNACWQCGHASGVPLGPQVSVVLAADVVYDNALTDAFLDCAAQLLRPRPGVRPPAPATQPPSHPGCCCWLQGQLHAVARSRTSGRICVRAGAVRTRRPGAAGGRLGLPASLRPLGAAGRRAPELLLCVERRVCFTLEDLAPAAPAFDYLCARVGGRRSPDAAAAPGAAGHQLGAGAAEAKVAGPGGLGAQRARLGQRWRSMQVMMLHARLADAARASMVPGRRGRAVLRRGPRRRQAGGRLGLAAGAAA
jgi:hypothetical protein